MTIHPDTEPATHASANSTSSDAEVRRVPHPIHHPRGRWWWIAQQAVLSLRSLTFLVIMVLAVNRIVTGQLGPAFAITITGLVVVWGFGRAARRLNRNATDEVPGAIIPYGYGVLGYAYTSAKPAALGSLARTMALTAGTCWLLLRHAGLDASFVVAILALYVTIAGNALSLRIDSTNGAGAWIATRGANILSALAILWMALSRFPATGAMIAGTHMDRVAIGRWVVGLGVTLGGIVLIGLLGGLIFAGRQAAPHRSNVIVPTLAALCTLALSGWVSWSLATAGSFPLWPCASAYTCALVGVWVGTRWAPRVRRRRGNSLPA